MQDTQGAWVQFLCREDTLEEAVAAHSSILAWRIPWTEEPGRPETMGSQRVRHDWHGDWIVLGSVRTGRPMLGALMDDR